ncbi:MAG: large-conductance mechanosensitive channel protein MscL [Bacilli bacterium]|jgi:large conductance mechanosensitive channel|nr:large-conductance mechanosensitive channel protein MscL [Bacilli bacterium]
MIKKNIEEFKKFIARGNVIDLAIGVIIGGAFSSIVTSLVNNILTPILGLVLGGADFSNLAITFKNTRIEYGAFIQSVIDFLIVAICIFALVKFINKIMHLKKKEEEKPAEPKKSAEVLLLEEIRDLLKEENKSKTNKKKKEK